MGRFSSSRKLFCTKLTFASQVWVCDSARWARERSSTHLMTYERTLTGIREPCLGLSMRLERDPQARGKKRLVHATMASKIQWMPYQIFQERYKVVYHGSVFEARQTFMFRASVEQFHKIISGSNRTEARETFRQPCNKYSRTWKLQTSELSGLVSWNQQVSKLSATQVVELSLLDLG